MTFKIEDTSNPNIDEKIHYLVTRPVEDIVDDGQGNFNISPIGFPVRDYSSEINQNPTRITPEFVMGYNNIVDTSSRLVVDYTEHTANFTELYGLLASNVGITSINRIGSVATVITNNPHGLVDTKSIEISGVNETEYNGSFTITYIDDVTFSYTVTGTPNTPATGSMNASYQFVDGDLLLLTSQDNRLENGYYVAKSNKWRVIYVNDSSNMNVKARSNVDVDLVSGGLPLITYSISNITTDASSTGRFYATVTTTEPHGFTNDNEVVIDNATVTAYNNTYSTIEVLSSQSFRVIVGSSLADDASGTGDVSYQVIEGDLINVNSQTDETENALYIAHDSASWEFYGFFYEYDGTENDNVAGDYGLSVDENGNPLNHYRKGYSLSETADFLKSKLEVQVEFGQYKGSDHSLSDNGGLVRWLLSGRKVNIGGTGKNTNVIVDPFGLGTPETLKSDDRTVGVVDPSDTSAVLAKQFDVAQSNKYTVWGLTNHHSNALKGFYNKSPFVKDYPFIYNSEYHTEVPYDIFNGGHLPYADEAERWRMSVTGASSTTEVDTRPIMIDMLWYHRDNSYHNNITLDLTNPAMVGRHTLSIINNLDTPDEIVLATQEITDASITTGSPTTITVPDGSTWTEGDFLQFTFLPGSTDPVGIVEYQTYVIAAGYPSGNDIRITTVDGTPVVITSAGTGTYEITRQVFDIYANDNVIDSLDDIVSATLNSGLSLVYPVVEGSVTNYYIKPRAKESLDDLAPKGSWTEETLSYDSVGANDINVYLNSAETDYITFTHPNLTSAELLEAINQHNDIVPVPFDPATTDLDSLTSLFVGNSLIDYTDAVNKTPKVRSKKTFVHLPTPLDLPDGTPFELDVSLPIVPDSDSFPFNTVGSLSGYRNYSTQPRVYVFSGKQNFDCDNLSVDSLTHVSGDATLTTTDDHDIYTSSFTDTNVDTSDNTIAVSNWKDITKGDIVRFAGVSLPTATPSLTTSTDYVVSNNECGKIKLEDTSGTAIDITALNGGTHSIVVQLPIRFKLRGATDTQYNTEFDGTVIDVNIIEFTVDSSAETPASGSIYIDRVISVNGSNGARGLSERDNANIFSPMPEVEFASDENIYHQTFSIDDVNGNGDTGVTRDIRTLVASVYPTSTNTFAWRMDNDPQLRMLQWSLMNVTALGGSNTTGSFANVAYERNKTIFDEFPTEFKDGSDGLFDVYSNPLSYIDLDSSSFSQQQINAIARIRYPDTLVPLTESDMLSSDDISTVGSYVYQASTGYTDLIEDFQAGRVEVKSDAVLLDVYTASLDINHDGVTDIPSSFYDHGATSKFLDFTSVESHSVSADYESYQRWLTKYIYDPDYIVNAQGDTNLSNLDPFQDVSQDLKDHIINGYENSSDRVTNSGNRYMFDDLDPIIDPEFEFSVGSTHKFIDFVSSNSDGSTSSETTLDDIRRRFWDSSYLIDSPSERKMQNAFHIDASGTSLEQIGKFNGSNWVPFAKIFSTDGISPSGNTIVDIVDYGNPLIDTTLDNALSSNVIGSRFKELGYVDAFASINTTDSNNSDTEDFIRNFVSGYSNKMPLRFYNGYKVLVSGNDTSDAYATDIVNPLVNTEIDNERIYTYSTNYFMSDYINTPSINSANYLNDNFALYEISGDDDVYSHDLNPAWWYFEEGNPTTDSVNSEVKDLITVSGMNYMADREFYTDKMQYSYTRIKMSFVFSAKAGRWLPLDYRQAPTTYLTPTFGSTALNKTDKSIVSKGTNGLSVDDYIDFNQPDVNNSFTVDVVSSNQIEITGTDPLFYIDDVISLYDNDSTTSFSTTITGRTVTTGNIYTFNTSDSFPSGYEVGHSTNASIAINTITTGEYPINLLTGETSIDYIWKHPSCLDPDNMYKELQSTPYWSMDSMKLNRFSYPFLSDVFPYDASGDLNDLLDHSKDSTGAESLRFTRLIEPNLASEDGIDFVVPNNSHGGSISPDNSLFLYQPHMWNVFWHMRPAVCAMEGTDIPSPTDRTGGVMADPVLNSIYCYPNVRDPQYYIPWHEKPDTDWLNSGWLLIDAKINDEDDNPERDLYLEFDAEIDVDEDREEFLVVESDNSQRP